MRATGLPISARAVAGMEPTDPRLRGDRSAPSEDRLRGMRACPPRISSGLRLLMMKIEVRGCGPEKEKRSMDHPEYPARMSPRGRSGLNADIEFSAVYDPLWSSAAKFAVMHHTACPTTMW